MVFTPGFSSKTQTHQKPAGITATHGQAIEQMWKLLPESITAKHRLADQQQNRDRRSVAV